MRGAPTRYSLLRSTRRLARVRTSAELLARRRRALVGELFRVAGPAVDARDRLERAAGRAYPQLLRAHAAHGEAQLRALGWPAREIAVELRPTDVWGVAAAEIASHTPVRRSLAEREAAAGLTGPTAAAAAAGFETFVELMLDAASRELLIRQLARALAATTRQVNVLEQRVAPELESEVSRIRATLEEREREDHTRFRQLLRHHRPAVG